MKGLVLFNIHTGSQHAQYPEYNHNNKWNVIHVHMHFVPIKKLALWLWNSWKTNSDNMDCFQLNRGILNFIILCCASSWIGGANVWIVEVQNFYQVHRQQYCFCFCHPKLDDLLQSIRWEQLINFSYICMLDNCTKVPISVNKLE